MPYTCSDDPTHQSATADVCSVCGALIGNVPPPPPPKPAGGWPTPAPAGMGAKPAMIPAPTRGGSSSTCSNCGVPRTPDMVFCENCGFDFATGTLDPADAAPPAAPPPAAPVPVAVPAAAPAAPVAPAPAADFSAAPTNVLKPPVAATMDVLVTVDLGPRERPDEAQPPPDQSPRIYLLDQDRLLIGRGSASVHPHIVLKDDTGISRGHAELIRENDGSYAVRDLDSANGTSVNGKELVGQELVPLKVGDQVSIGFWHTLTVRQR